MSNFYIKRVKLDGYRNIRGTEVAFCDGLNIIIGPNGCGKSNFLWFLVYIHTNDFDFEYSADFEYYSNRYNNFEYKYKKTFIEGRGFGGNIVLDNDALNQISTSYLLLNYNIPTIIPCFSIPDDITILNFNLVPKNRLVLNTQSQILPSIFKNEFSFDFIDFDNIIKQQIANYTPVKDIQVKNRILGSRNNEKEIKMNSLLYEFQTEDGEWYTWSELSDGTRRVVWLVLNILTTNKDIIFIEEPELGIHPHQLQKLMEFVKEQSKEKQIILTTHSPEVLNHCITSEDLDRIIIAKMTDDGTKLYHLDEKQKAKTLKYLKNELSIADYWLHSDLEK